MDSSGLLSRKPKRKAGAGKSLVRKFCGHCKQTLADPSEKFCRVCGLPSEPISIYEKLKTDERLNKKDKTALNYAAKISLLCAILEIVAMLFAIATFWGQYSGTLEHIDYLQAEFEKPESKPSGEFAEYPSIDELMQFADYEEYLAYLQNKGLVYNRETSEKARVYWNSAYIALSSSSPAPSISSQLETSRRDLLKQKNVAIFVSAVGAAVVLFELYCAAVSAAFLREKEWCLRRYNEAFYSNAYVCLFTGNVICSLMIIHANNTIVRLIQKMESGEGYHAPLDKKIQALRGENNGEWECSCGYFNPRGEYECRSCGKYRSAYLQRK